MRSAGDERGQGGDLAHITSVPRGSTCIAALADYIQV